VVIVSDLRQIDAMKIEDEVIGKKYFALYLFACHMFTLARKSGKKRFLSITSVNFINCR
jgi:hypothetical protein